jgi:two-component system cell cycle sensor histidine kinase/response regulator CckA
LNRETNKKVIFLVEDEEPLRELCRRFLEREGYRVLTAANGQEAAKEWERSASTVDLLITDIALCGGPNGDGVARACRKDRPDLPVIFVSGNFSRSEDAAIDLVLHTAYLMKPFEFRELRQALRVALGL